MSADELLQLMVKYRVVKAKTSFTRPATSNFGGGMVTPSVVEVLEFELHPSAFALQAVSDIAAAELKAGPIGEANGGLPTDEEMLFASSPYPITRDELNAKPPEKA